MWQTIMLGLLGGVLGGNALPHFLRGITRRRYPSALGNGPIPNFVAGWAGLHAGPGAFGRREDAAPSPSAPDAQRHQ
jgi:hypothetical protein